MIYPLRSMPLMLQFVEEHIDDLAEDLRHDFAEIVESLLSKIPVQGPIGAAQGEVKVLQKAAKDVLRIVRLG